jgi:hypothetical protein
VVSLLLLVAVVVLWAGVGRQRRGMSVVVGRHTQYACMTLRDAVLFRRVLVPWPLQAHDRVEVQRDNLSLHWDPADASDVGDAMGARERWLWPGPGTPLGFAAYGGTQDFASRSGSARYAMRTVNLRLPYWLLAVVFAAAPAWWLVFLRKRRLRARRVVLGLCEACGYDLRATPGQCPECGAAPAATIS